MRLWLDDLRKPPDSTWTWAKTAAEAIARLKTGLVVEASLDHDLAAEHYAGYTAGFGVGTGQEVAQFIAQMRKPPRLVTIHSLNVVGAMRMRAELARSESHITILTKPRRL